MQNIGEDAFLALVPPSWPASTSSKVCPSVASIQLFGYIGTKP